MYKRILAVLVSFAAAFSMSVLPAQAAAKKFKNCKALVKVYPGGVSKSGAVNQGGEIKNLPTVNNAVYKKNKGLDRDKDGIACEN